MTSERWEQVKAIFHAAVERDPAERSEFLRETCGDDQELRREVESLLDSEQDPRSALTSKAMGPGILASPLPEHPLTPSAIVGDRYEVERELGRGGMSAVYLARDRQLLSKRVVIKVLLEETDQDPWIRQKFMQEMEALARIDHPGVVGVLDSGLTSEGRRFLVMQYIEGVNLRSAIPPGGMELARAADLIRQIGQALAAAHEQGVWHRDLKPENIMLQCLGGQDHLKLIDFGISAIQNSQFTGEQTKVAGSFAYMAPEQLRGQPCAASDIYALGVVAHEILTGHRPDPAGGSAMQVPEAARRTIHKALSLYPESRQGSVREFSEELYRGLTGTGTGRRTGVPASVEIAHVLCADLVGYSQLPIDQQKEYLSELQQMVRESPLFLSAESAGDAISLPTGDGLALEFFGNPTVPVECALDIAVRVKNKPHLKLRMGIHSGPVYRVADVNASAAGDGIHIAQRVTDCGDAGHILLSNTVADVLLQLSQWAPYLTDLGECTVRQGVALHIYSLATGEAGNRRAPGKLAVGSAAKVSSKTVLAAAVVLITLAAAGALWWFRGRTAPPADLPSIAVLPFVDLSPEKNQEYFSEGIAEQLLNSLAKIEGLRVMGRRSSFRFKGNEDPRDIGKALNVSSILEGSVSRQGNQARIVVRLTKASDGFSLWSNSYNPEMTDIFAAQDAIASAVTEALKVKLLGNNARGPTARSSNVEAYNAYLQGRYFLARGSKESRAKAVTFFEEASRLDPLYAPAWAGLGDAQINQAGSADIEQGYETARESVSHALKLDPNLGEAHAAMGEIHMLYDWDWSGADASFQLALAASPGDARVLRSVGSLDRILGRLEESIRLYRRAVEIEPLSGHSNLGLALYYAGRQEDAKTALEKALEVNPDSEVAHVLLSRIYLTQSRPQDALTEAEKEKPLIWRLYGLALTYHALGRKEESDANLAELIAKFPKDAPYLIGAVYADREQPDRAFEWLERAYSERDPGLTEMKVDPLLKGLGRDPRYLALLRKVGLPN